jgi:hypothetical protein
VPLSRRERSQSGGPTVIGLRHSAVPSGRLPDDRVGIVADDLPAIGTGPVLAQHINVSVAAGTGESVSPAQRDVETFLKRELGAFLAGGGYPVRVFRKNTSEESNEEATINRLSLSAVRL